MKRTISIGSLFVICALFVLFATLSISVYVGKLFLDEIDDLAAKNELQRNAAAITRVANSFLFVSGYLPDTRIQEREAELENEGIIAIYDQDENIIWEKPESDEILSIGISHAPEIKSIKYGDSYIFSIPIYIDAQTSSLQEYTTEYFSDTSVPFESNSLMGYAVVENNYISSLATDVQNRYIVVGSTIVASMIALLSFTIYRMIGRPLALLKARISSDNIDAIRSDLSKGLIATDEITSLTMEYLAQHRSILSANEYLEDKVDQRTFELNQALDAYSRAKLPLIPGESCHPFHGKVATHTRAKLPP